MADYTSFGQIAKKLKLDKPIQRGIVRAANKALSKTKTTFVKDLKAATGLKTGTINDRIRVAKARFKDLNGSINLATKVGVQIGEFAPRSKKVDIGSKTYYGVTAKIAGSREFIPGGFLRAVASGKEIVMARRATISGGAYRNVKGAKYPTTLLRTSVLRDIAQKNIELYKREMRNEYNRIVNHEVEFSLQQYISK